MARLVFGMNVSLDGYVDHEKFGPDAVLKPVSRSGGWLRRLRMPPQVSGRLGAGLGAGYLAAGLAEDMIDALEVRALWRRFGL